MFSIVVPLFNESENIIPLLKEIELSLKEYDNYEIVLINDSSTDNTAKIISNIKNKSIKIINNKNNKGQSYSIYKGIQLSLNETIITLDGDGQNDPRDIPKLLNLYFVNDKIKLVGGIRKKRQDSYIKIYSSKIANYVRSKILSDNCKDTGCSLKVFSKNIFLKFPYFDGMHRFLPALFSGFGYKTFFLEVDHRKRKKGFSKYGTFDRLYKGIIDIRKVINILKENKDIK